MYWSPSSGTALAEAELEYDEQHLSRAAYIKFELVKLPPVLEPLRKKGRLYALIWTTTPWTLPANSAIAVHNDFDYCVFKLKSSGDMLLVASARLEEVLTAGAINVDDVEVVSSSIRGEDLANVTNYTNSLRGRKAEPQPIIHADFVTLSSGSGLVHMAPGHGFDDYNVCRQHGIATFAPVDNQGCFTSEAFPDQPALLQGKEVFKAGSKSVIELLKNSNGRDNLVWATHNYKHKYPIDWRTKQPLMIRATAQWFADVDSIKVAALKSLNNVKFLPDTGKLRLESFVNGRSQWCISRQRAWGVPIPALYQLKDGELDPIMTAQTVAHIIKVIDERGIDAWWTDAEDEPAWISSELPHGSYIRGKDTMDVWFDSGTSWTQIPANRSPPADVYIEGTDQHRGWFQSSLLTFIAHQAATSETTLSSSSVPNAPYKTLITHGFILDQDGRKMSKSLGNVISPNQIIDGSLLGPMKKRKGQNKTPNSQPTYDAMGSDALRLWVASSDYTRDVAIGQPILKAVNTSLHKFRVTFKWLLGALDEYGPAQFEQSTEFLARHGQLVDHIAEHQLSKTVRITHAAFTAFEPFKGVNAITRYVNLDLSAFYFESAKDPLYAGDEQQRLRVQHTCYRIFHGILQMLTPLLPLLVTEVIDHASPTLRQLLDDPSHDPFKAIWQPRADPDHSARAHTLDTKLGWITNAHAAVKAAQEEAREHKQMGSGLQCRAILQFPTETAHAAVDFFRDATATGELQEIFVVSDIEVKSTAEEAPDDDTMSWRYEREFEVPLKEGNGVARARAVVMAPRREKCPRCWRYTAVEVERLCGRCEDVVGEVAGGEGNASAESRSL